jgi:hypothetical protein
VSQLPDDPADPERDRKRPLVKRIADGMRKGVERVKTKVVQQLEFSFARFKGEESEIEFPIDITHETVWATEQQIADLFGIDQSVANRHVKNVFAENELELSEATHAKIACVRREGGREVQRDLSHYSLDVILAVGYRVSSRRATRFRQWATRTLKAYVVDGYALNERRLRDDPDALKNLAARVRALRSDERQIYAAVRDLQNVRQRLR